MGEQEKDGSKTAQVRMTAEMYDEASKVFEQEGYTFSSGIRMMLEAMIAAGKIPFRPDADKIQEAENQKLREKEIGLLDDFLGTSKKTPEERMLKAIFGHVKGETSKDMPDDTLREWGLQCGLPESLSLTALGDLYDSGLFPADPLNTGFSMETTPNPDVFEEGARRDSYESMLIGRELEENVIGGLEDTYKKLRRNALKYLYEMDTVKNRED